MFAVMASFPSVVDTLRLTFKTREAAEIAAQRLADGDSEITDDIGTSARLACKPAFTQLVDLVAVARGKRDIERAVEEALLAERTTGFGV